MRRGVLLELHALLVARRRRSQGKVLVVHTPVCPELWLAVALEVRKLVDLIRDLRIGKRTTVYIWRRYLGSVVNGGVAFSNSLRGALRHCLVGEDHNIRVLLHVDQLRFQVSDLGQIVLPLLQKPLVLRLLSKTLLLQLLERQFLTSKLLLDLRYHLLLLFIFLMVRHNASGLLLEISLHLFYRSVRFVEFLKQGLVVQFLFFVLLSKLILGVLLQASFTSACLNLQFSQSLLS